jgi:hypothetical protein
MDEVHLVLKIKSLVQAMFFFLVENRHVTCPYTFSLNR